MNKKFAEIKIKSEYIELGQFLKFVDIVQSGGEAKAFLANNNVLIKGEIDVRRGRKLRPGDKIEVNGNGYLIK